MSGPGEPAVVDTTLVRDMDLEAAQALRPVRGQPTSHRIPRWWALVALAAVVAAWWLVLSQSRGAVVPGDLLASLVEFGRSLAGTSTTATPAYLQSAPWAQALALAVDTLAMSVVAAGLAGLGALLTLAFASRTLTTGPFAVTSPAVGRLVRGGVRALYTFTRAVPDYLWALIVVFLLKAGILAGALAMALHNFGVLGRLGADVVEDLEVSPLESLRSSGAGNLQILFYGALPQVLPQFLTFLLYRWEVMIRASAVVGFVTAAGLGYQLSQALAFFRYTEIALLLVVYVVVVFGVDLASAGLRRLAR